MKEEAIEQILELARRHDITLEDLREALSTASGQPGERSGGLRGLLPRLFAYLGGIFVFAGVCVFIGINWEAMNTAARIIVTLGSGLAVFGMALAALSRSRFEKAATPLFLIAAFLQPTGIVVALDELSAGGNWHHAGLLTAGVMAAQQGAAFLARRRTTLLFTTLVFSSTFLMILFDLLHVGPETSATTLGLSLVLISIATDRTRHALITPFWYLVGSVSLLYGVFDILERTPFEILFLLAACGLVYLSVYVRSRTLLVSGTVAILSYIGYFTSQHFLESWGWPLALIVLGLVLIGLSASAVRINQKYIRT